MKNGATTLLIKRMKAPAVTVTDFTTEKEATTALRIIAKAVTARIVRDLMQTEKIATIVLNARMAIALNVPLSIVRVETARIVRGLMQTAKETTTVRNARMAIVLNVLLSIVRVATVRIVRD